MYCCCYGGSFEELDNRQMIQQHFVYTELMSGSAFFVILCGVTAFFA